MRSREAERNRRGAGAFFYSSPFGELQRSNESGRGSYRPKSPPETKSEVFDCKGVLAGFGVLFNGNARHSSMVRFCSGVGSVSRIRSGPLGSPRIRHWRRLRVASARAKKG